MATRKLKSNGYVRQLNLNETAGELVQSFNIDLRTELGKIKLARPLKRVATATQIGDEKIQAFISQGTASQTNEVYACTEDTIYRATGDFTTFTSDETGPQALEDAVVFQGQLVSSTVDDLDAWNFNNTFTSDWWTDRGNPQLTSNSGGADVPRVLEVARIGAETLVVLDGSQVHAYTGGITGSPIVSVTMDIDDQLTATCFKSSIRRGFIGTYTSSADQAYVIEWDVASTNYSQAYPTGSRSVLAMELVNDVPLIINELGEIKIFNNSGFTTVAQFPFFGKATFVDQATNPNNINRPIHPKGIKRQGNNIYIYTNWRNSDNTIDDFPIEENTPNGLWVLDLTTYSLTHLCSQENNHVFGNQGASPILILNDYHSRIFMGGELNTNSNEEGIWIEDLGATNHYGHFTSVEIESDSIEDSFNQIVIKALLGASDSVVVKYRGENDVLLPINFSGTWLTSNQINTTEDLSHALTRFTEGHYDEVEITSGSGSGRLAHITDISASSGTYQITLDETLGTAGESATARIDNWIKIPETMTQADGEVKRLGIGEVSSWVQVKVEMRGKSGYPEIREIQLLTNNKQGK